MKKILFSLVFILFLTGCGTVSNNKDAEIQPPSELFNDINKPYGEKIQPKENMLIGVCPEETYKCGYINIKGEMVLPFEYDFVSSDINEKNFVSVLKMVNYQNKYSIVNKEGKLIKNLPDNMHIRSSFSDEGYALTSYDDDIFTVGIINSNGEIIIPVEYWFIEQIRDNYFLVMTKQNKHGIIDINNKFVLNPEYNLYSGRKWYKDDFVILNIQKEDKTLCGLVSYDGKTVVPFEYQAIYPVGKNLYSLKDFQGKITYYDKDGVLNKIKEKTDKENITVTGYNGKYLSFSKDKKEGLMDLDGNILISPEYRLIYFKDDGMIHCIENAMGKDEYYDSNARIINNLSKYINSNPYLTLNCSGERCILCLIKNAQEYYGLIDFQGNTIMPVKYVRIAKLTDDFYVVTKQNFQKDYEHAVYDKNGNVFIPFNKYENISNLSVGVY